MEDNKKKETFFERAKKRAEKVKQEIKEKREKAVQKKLIEKEEKEKRLKDTEEKIKTIEEDQTKIQIVQPEEKKEPVGIIGQIKELNEKIDAISKPKKKKKDKEFDLPGKVKTKLKKLAMKNKLLIIILRTNRAAHPIVADIKNGFVFIEGIPHNCSTDFIYLWKGKYPMIVLPEWDLNPIGTKEYYESIEGGRISYPVAALIRMIEDKEILTKGKLQTKHYIWIGLAIIAGLYVLVGT